MKLAIVGWRPWSITQRYKSLIVNAKKLGHQILGIATEHFKDGPMNASLFRDLGVRYIAGGGDGLHIMGQGAVWRELDKFNPDAIFGECFWCTTEEKAARDWAIRKTGRYFVLDHTKILPLKIADFTKEPRKHFKRGLIVLTVNEINAEEKSRKYGIQTVPIGFPNFDLDYEIDIKEVKVGLEVTDQPTIALFLMSIGNQGGALKKERERLFPLLTLAEEKGWRVFIHLHADEQGKKYGLMNKGCPRHKFLMSLQDRGAVFVSSIPGDFNGLIFNSCGPMALTRIADIVGGTYGVTAFQAYVAAKKYFWIDAGHYPFNWEELLNRHPNLVKVDPDYGNIVETIEEEAGSFEQHPAYVKRWFYKLDGKCWMRMLALAEATRRR